MLEDHRDERLKHLLSLKRLEMPSEDRWQEFGAAFENKRLSAINDSRIKRCCSSVISMFNFKRVIFSSGAAALVLFLSFVAVNNNRMVRESVLAKNIGREYVKFVSDSLLSKSNDVDVDSYVCSMRYIDNGINYVNDGMFASHSNFSKITNL